MKFRVALYKSEEGYAVNVLSLPECWSQGATEAEAIENITDAIREYLDADLPAEEGADTREIEVS